MHGFQPLVISLAPRFAAVFKYLHSLYVYLFVNNRIKKWRLPSQAVTINDEKQKLFNSKFKRNLTALSCLKNSNIIYISGTQYHIVSSRLRFSSRLRIRAMAALKHNSSGGAFRPFTSGYSLLIPRPSVCLLVFCAVVSLAGSSVSVAGLLSSSAVQQWVARSFALDYWQRAEFPPIIVLMYIV